MSDLEAIRERHRPTERFGGRCIADDQLWPCDTAQLLAALDGLRTRIEALPTQMQNWHSEDADGENAEEMHVDVVKHWRVLAAFDAATRSATQTATDAAK